MTTNNSVNSTLSGTTGSGNFVGSTSPAITTPDLIGVTNASNANAGSVGQLISSVIASASAVSLTSGNSADVTSISLTAGDWDVWGNSYIAGSAAVLAVGSVWVSSTSATLPDSSLLSQHFPPLAGAANAIGLPAPQLRFNVSGTTTVYLSVRSVFTGTATACGGIYARRVR